MELISWDGFTVGAILAGIVPIPIVWFASKIFRWASNNRILGRIFFIIQSTFLPRILIFGLVSYATGVVFNIYSLKAFGIPINGTVAGLTLFSSLLLISQYIFAHVGIHSAELSVSGGTDYSRSLNLCRNSFSLLGTGASKLSDLPMFTETVMRCRSKSEPIRFLLSHPDNEVIKEAERRADVIVGTYRRGVVRSLEELQRLHERGANFEVRFYKGNTIKEFENFRMMFIDDEILLLSYNIYGGKDSGRSTPQIVLRKGAFTSDTDGFYFAFKSYYDQLWESSEKWDFNEYV